MFPLAGGAPTVFSVANPMGLAIGPNGTVYTGADYGSTLEEITPNCAMNCTTTLGTNLGIQSLAVNAAGDVFSAGGNGTVTELIGGSETLILDEDANFGLAFDSAGDLFATWQQPFSVGGGIEEFNPAGTKIANIATTYLPTGVVYDPNSGTVFMSYSKSLNDTGGGIEEYQENLMDVITSAGSSLYVDLGTTGQPDAIAVIVPEPSSFLLAGLALLPIALFQVRRMRKNRATEPIRG